MDQPPPSNGGERHGIGGCGPTFEQPLEADGGQRADVQRIVERQQDGDGVRVAWRIKPGLQLVQAKSPDGVQPVRCGTQRGGAQQLG